MLFNSTDEFSAYTTLEERTFALLLKIDEIESNQATNPNGLDYLTGFTINYETPKTATGTIIIPAIFTEVSNTERSEIRVVNAYNYNYAEVGGGDQTNANNQTLKQHINNDRPVPCGILHKGAASNPTGGGHWITVIGYEDDATAPGGGWWIVHDPFGEIFHGSGIYDTSEHQGESEKYSYQLMESRWTVDGSSDGWCVLFGD